MNPNTDLPDFLGSTPQGTWRIAGTRVSLNRDPFPLGRRDSGTNLPGLPSLSLAQVYGTIAYYLSNRDKLDAYLQQGHREMEKLQQELEGTIEIS